jgi:hypothetical protein
VKERKETNGMLPIRSAGGTVLAGSAKFAEAIKPP